MSRIADIMNKADEVKPFSEKNGRKVVSFEDYSILANAEGVEPTSEMPDRLVNDNGEIAQSGAKFVAASPEKLLDNRYKVKKNKNQDEMWIVTDPTVLYYLRNGEQYCPKKQITAYVIKKDEKEYVLDRVDTVSDTVFMADFTKKLPVDLAKDIWHLIEGAGEIYETPEMPI